MSEPCEPSDDGNYWWLIIVIGLIIIGIVILIGILTRKSRAEEEECKSAEYPSKAENMSCDPNIVEVSLTASDNEVQILNGDTTKLYNYNKSFPGPLIDAKVGDQLIVLFHEVKQLLKGGSGMGDPPSFYLMSFRSIKPAA